MPIDKETARLADQKIKSGKAKKLDPNIKEKMSVLYEEVLDHIIMHQDELSNVDRVRLVQSLSNYLLPKTKSNRDLYTIEELAERNKLHLKDQGLDPTK